jgi:hypothetical protein
MIPPEFGRRAFALTGRGRKAVETNFADASSTLPSQALTFNTTVHGGSNFQIGNHNCMQIQSAVETIVHVIDSASASATQKARAKDILARAFQDPTVATVMGGLGSIAAQALTK